MPAAAVEREKRHAQHRQLPSVVLTPNAGVFKALLEVPILYLADGSPLGISILEMALYPK